MQLDESTYTIGILFQKEEQEVVLKGKIEFYSAILVVFMLAIGASGAWALSPESDVYKIREHIYFVQHGNVDCDRELIGKAAQSLVDLGSTVIISISEKDAFRSEFDWQESIREHDFFKRAIDDDGAEEKNITVINLAADGRYGEVGLADILLSDEQRRSGKFKMRIDKILFDMLDGFRVNEVTSSLETFLKEIDGLANGESKKMERFAMKVMGGLILVILLIVIYFMVTARLRRRRNERAHAEYRRKRTEAMTRNVQIYDFCHRLLERVSILFEGTEDALPSAIFEAWRKAGGHNSALNAKFQEICKKTQNYYNTLRRGDWNVEALRLAREDFIKNGQQQQLDRSLADIFTWIFPVEDLTQAVGPDDRSFGFILGLEPEFFGFRNLQIIEETLMEFSSKFGYAINEDFSEMNNRTLLKSIMLELKALFGELQAEKKIAKAAVAVAENLLLNNVERRFNVPGMDTIRFIGGYACRFLSLKRQLTDGVEQRQGLAELEEWKSSFTSALILGGKLEEANVLLEREYLEVLGFSEEGVEVSEQLQSVAAYFSEEGKPYLATIGSTVYVLEPQKGLEELDALKSTMDSIVENCEAEAEFLRADAIKVQREAMLEQFDSRMLVILPRLLAASKACADIQRTGGNAELLKVLGNDRDVFLGALKVFAAIEQGGMKVYDFQKEWIFPLRDLLGTDSGDEEIETAFEKVEQSVNSVEVAVEHVESALAKDTKE